MQSINNNAPVKCSRSITINADAKKVWKVLTDINNWPAWQKDITLSEMTEDLKSGNTFTWKSGGIRIRSKLHTVVHQKQFGWTGKTMGIFAIHNWSLFHKDGKTTVYAEESMEGFLAGLFRKSLNQNLEAGMQKWLDHLKQKCESYGEGNIHQLSGPSKFKSMVQIKT
jgi:uncharacterized protein YndB with AHSA1/START domain